MVYKISDVYNVLQNKNIKSLLLNMLEIFLKTNKKYLKRYVYMIDLTIYKNYKINPDNQTSTITYLSKL